MEGQTTIVIEAFRFLKAYNPAFSWERSGIKLVQILSPYPFPLCDDEIRILCDSLVGINGIKDGRWHKITLKRVYEKGGYQKADECYYEKINIELVPHKCLNCGIRLGKEESDLIDLYGVTPYCGQYCAEIDGGVPMPVSSGALVFDKWANNNK